MTKLDSAPSSGGQVSGADIASVAPPGPASYRPQGYLVESIVAVDRECVLPMTSPNPRPRCKVCAHQHSARIELEMAAGRSLQSVGDEFGLHKDAIARHWKNHTSPTRKAELIGGPVAIARLAKRAAEEDRSLIDYLSILRSELLHLFLSAKDRGLTFDAASIAQRLLNTLEAIGRLNGQLRQAGITVNNVNSVSGPTIVLNDPQVIKLQAAIIRALSPFPEARASVIEALRALDTQPDGAKSPIGDLPNKQPTNGSQAPPLAISGPPAIEASSVQ